MVIDIVRITPENAGLLDRVAADVFDDVIHSERLSAYLAQGNHFLYVAVRDGEVVGQAAAVIIRHPDTVTSLYIDNLGVTPALHRQGVASRLIAALFALGKAEGCGEAWVGTEVDNRPAQGIYEKFGGKGETFTLFVYAL